MAKGITWMTSPFGQGQMVEFSYCQVGDILMRKVYDHSDRTVVHHMVKLYGDEVDSIDPINKEPAIDEPRWTSISEAKAQQFFDSGP